MSSAVLIFPCTAGVIINSPVKLNVTGSTSTNVVSTVAQSVTPTEKSISQTINFSVLTVSHDPNHSKQYGYDSDVVHKDFDILINDFQIKGWGYSNDSYDGDYDSGAGIDVVDPINKNELLCDYLNILLDKHIILTYKEK